MLGLRKEITPVSSTSDIRKLGIMKPRETTPVSSIPDFKNLGKTTSISNSFDDRRPWEITPISNYSDM